MPTDYNMCWLLRLLQLSDSALPVGGFSFSNALESAVAYGVVHDASTLEAFTFAAMRLASTTDCVAARVAYEAVMKQDFESVLRADEALIARKLTAEQRMMSQRMGRKMAELVVGLVENEMLSRWLEAIKEGTTAGTHAVTQGVAFAVCGAEPRALFGAMLYGVEAMMCNAALRLMRLTHHSTQRIMFNLSLRVDALWQESATLGIEDMYGFAPQFDMLSSLHEKGRSRMFMN